MSAKSRFLKKLQEQHPRSRSIGSKNLADIAAFRQQMTELKSQMEKWLTGTGITVDETSVSLVEMLAGGRAFSVPGIQLCYENRIVKFTPVFLYGQGVTGCVEMALCTQGLITPLYRLFMRSGKEVNWTYAIAGNMSPPHIVFNEDAFFNMISALLPA